MCQSESVVLNTVNMVTIMVDSSTVNYDGNYGGEYDGKYDSNYDGR